MQMWTKKVWLVLILTGVAQAAKRDRVVIKGTTLVPGWTRREASQAVVECPAKQVALANYTHCCSTFVRNNDAAVCPTYAPDARFIDYKDPKECCPDLTGAKDCAPNKCKTKTRGKSTCPLSHNFAFDDGLKCCKFGRRGSSCPTGAAETTLQVTDPASCCYNNEHVNCVDKDNVINLCHSLAKDSCPAAKVNYSDPTYNSAYKTEYVLTNGCETGGVYNYMLFVDGRLNQHFILDLGCSRPIKTFNVRPTKDGCCGTPRGTKNFRIEVSDDYTTWTPIATGQLDVYLISVHCSAIPMYSFNTTTRAAGRFLKFISIDHHFYSGGIHYLGWIYHT